MRVSLNPSLSHEGVVDEHPLGGIDSGNDIPTLSMSILERSIAPRSEFCSGVTAEGERGDRRLFSAFLPKNAIPRRLALLSLLRQSDQKVTQPKNVSETFHLYPFIDEVLIVQSTTRSRSRTSSNL